MSTLSAASLLRLALSIPSELLNTRSHATLDTAMHKYLLASSANSGKHDSFIYK